MEKWKKTLTTTSAVLSRQSWMKHMREKMTTRQRQMRRSWTLWAFRSRRRQKSCQAWSVALPCV
eukprot:252841-Amphidinium_carterae.1